MTLRAFDRKSGRQAHKDLRLVQGGTSTAEGLFYPYNELIRFLTGKIFFIIYKHFHLLTFWWTEFGGLAGGGKYLWR